MSLLYEKKTIWNGFGLGWFTAVGIILTCAKAVGVVPWSWWLVTFPLWSQLAFLSIVGMIFGVYTFCKYGENIEGLLALLEEIREQGK